MLNPYEVLGVGKYDDDQTVKKAYRQLSKQYHPDNNLNNPNKAAAEETFKKIQQAYEQVMHERSIGIGGPNDPKRYSAGATTGTTNRYTGNSYSGSSNSQNNTDNSYRNNTYQNNNYQNNNYQNNNYQNNNYQNNNYGNDNGNAGNNRQSGYYTNGGFNQYNNAYDNGNNSNNNYNNNYYSNNNNGGFSTGYGSAYSDSYYGRNGEKAQGSRPGYGYKERENNTYTNWNSRNFGGYYTGSPQNAQATYQDTESALNAVASYINNRNFFGALDALDGISERNDVWYYYSAVANLALGNNITAMSRINTALAMNPGRPEYMELKKGMESGSLQYRGRADAFVPQKANKGNICVKLIIANIALNIFCGGGGLCLSGPCGAC